MTSTGHEGGRSLFHFLDIAGIPTSRDVGIGDAASMYGLYHLGYGMGGTELAFLTGLGVVYAVAFTLARNLLVLWPLLTPLGSFYANVEAGDIDLPWASIAGFADVLGLMIAAWWLTHRHYRRKHSADVASRVEAVT